MSTQSRFDTTDGTPVPALTAAQMREVDRIAVQEFGLGISFEPLFGDRYWLKLERSRA